MSLFFFGNNFYKNRQTFKISSPQSLEVYRILLVETTLESIMFYYTFSVISTVFVPCTLLLYDSTSATRTLKLSTTLLGISCGIYLISFLMMSSFVCGLSSQTLSFRYPLRKQSGWHLGNRITRGYRFDAKWVCPMGSYAWSIQESEKKSDRFHKKCLIELWAILMFQLLLCCHTVHGMNIVLITKKV